MPKPLYVTPQLRSMTAEQLDVLEDENDLPREQCHVRGCECQARYEWAGAFGTRWLCAHHRPLYKMHDAILRRIRQA